METNAFFPAMLLEVESIGKLELFYSFVLLIFF